METQGCSATINRVRVGTIHHVRIAGVIDETFPLTSKIRDLVGFIVLDLGQVERISSFGVSKWIEFTSKLPPGALSLYLVNTPPVMVDQLNMVEGFAGVARVLSVLAPYLCRACGEDRLRLVDLQAEAAVIAEGRAPVHTCPVCAGKLEFADLPSEFFDHARRQQFGTVDPLVMRYLRAIMPSAPVPLTTHLKIVQDDITYITLASELTGDLNVRRLATGLEGRVAFDFSHVSRVEPDAIPKLEQVLDTASRGAQVVLCRVTPPALTALARFSRPSAARINTLWLPSECRHCGNENPQRTLASEYLARLLANASPERECPVCGGTARLPAIPQLVQLLSQTPLVETRLEDIEALEPRALSQYLFSTNTEPSENEGRESTSDLNNDIGATRLRVLRRLGQGGMAEVFLARQVGVKGFEKYVVMKKVLSQYAENTDFVDMLFAEARANARLTHPNVVQTFDMGMSEGVAYILMEYVRGPDLKRLMTEMKRKGISLPLEHALRIISETAAGLHYAHSYVDPAGVSHPVVHCDVSPHNILVSLDGAIKLGDFGIAKVQGEEVARSGVVKGKISYISPEAAAGRPLDARNDVFSLGVVFFELLTGQLPFKRDHDAATLSSIVRDPAPVPSQLKPEIPQDVSEIILRTLEKDRMRRTPSAAALREEIEAVMVRLGLHSSPAEVARFFLNTLGDRLAEFGPISPATGSFPAVVSASNSPTRTGPSPILKGSTGETPMEPPPPGTALKSPNWTGPSPILRGSTGETPMVPPPAGTALSAVLAAPVPPATPAAQPPVSPAPAAPPVVPPAAPPKVSPAPPPSAEVVPAASRAIPTRWVVAGVIGLLSLIAVGVVVAASRSGASVEVLNREPGEQLYVAGLRVEDPQTLDPTEVRQRIISTSVEGRLRRFGLAVREDVLDVHTLTETQPVPGSQGTLKVSEPTGCLVEVDGRMAPGTTPVSLSIEAGRELEVRVSCPQHPTWSRRVMAVPGQEVVAVARAHEPATP
ncbi:serine/threonine protein kinase [Cystobacter fuscus]|uniref:non-specific serine/threonine protein kinase n=1 Tax=Cystobacter fuscus TaxID=43 RepID=A0A250J972_9BACT|nr:serine/threonine-protein kinase [Cystobacter fuscus]ATB40469.1 serine/threonine protein kinase [Cystobacter fuscus]